jgi:hypothetical protein
MVKTSIKMKAETGEIKPQPKECLELPEAQRVKEEHPKSIEREHSLVGTLVSDSWTPQV